MTRRRTPADQHSEWLALLDIDGPFFTPPALSAAFGPAVPRTPPSVREQVLDRLDQATSDDYDQRLDWLRWLLADVLGFDPGRDVITFEPDERHTHTFTTHTGPVTLTPWAVAHDPGKPDQPRLLVLADPGGSIGLDVDAYEPDRRHNHDGWPATPVQRATRLCRALGCRFALVTNGAKLTLVAVADGVVGHGSWHAPLFQAEPVHLDSLRAVLNATRFYGVADDQTPEALLDTSIARQQELTGDLGDQVRRAAELLVGALSRADRRHGRRLLADVAGRQVYEAAVTVLMRIVFLLTAEERGLLPANNAVYRDDYAIGTLRDRLAETLRTGRASAQRRSHAWHRLLALSRAVHAGVEHDQLRLPGYGGRLFDPDRFPFLEGRLPDGSRIDADLVDDHTVHEILTAIQVVDGRPIAFRALEVEQIGHVYESLLDHSAVTAQTPVVGLVGAARGLEPEVELGELEAARLSGDDVLLELLAERTGKKATWLGDRLAAPLDEQVERTLRAACGNDADLHDRVRPVGNLLRLDLRGLPLVFLTGDTYVTETSAKRDSGTAYTTRELAEEIAKHALDPLIHSPGPQDSADPADWKLRSSTEILDLKICDPAVGSGAIIVAAVRYLADALVRAWLAEGEVTDQDLVAGEATGQLDVTVRARREVVARCIYAVDRDPMAVDMAKMSLWLVTMAKDHPFTFLDHAIKCGDSLLGITGLDQLTWLHLDPKQGRKIHRQAVIPTELALAAEQPSLYQAEPQQQSLDYGHFSSTLDRLIATARTARERLREVPDTDLDAEATKAALLTEADDAVGRLRVIADAVVAAALASATERASAYDDRLKQIAPYVGQLADDAAPTANSQQARWALASRSARWKEAGNPSQHLPRRFLHWPLEFPEVFSARENFDTMLGNPPFLGGTKISGPHGSDYLAFIGRSLAGGATGRGRADLVCYFFRRAASIAGGLGFLATNSISQGDSSLVGLDPLVRSPAGRIHRAEASTRWPGQASVHVAKVWWRSSGWSPSSPSVLDGVPVDDVEADLYPTGRVGGRPLQLGHPVVPSEGVKPQGMGFLLAPQRAKELLDAHADNATVIRPYINGEWAYHSPTRQADSERWIIDFGDMGLEEAAQFEAPYGIVLSEVKPERDRNKRKSHRERWWQYGEKRLRLRSDLEQLEECLVLTRHSRWCIPVRVSTKFVLSEALVVFPTEDDSVEGLLLSGMHRIWADRYSSTIGEGLRYTSSSTFNTFPWPSNLEAIAATTRDLCTWRRTVVAEEDVGVSDLYSAYHDASVTTATVEHLRAMHRELDRIVLEAFGWSDVSLDHGFFETRYGRFYIMSDAARYELLERLLELNLSQHAEQTGKPYEQVVQEAAGD